MLIDYVVEETEKYLNSIDKSTRKAIGQFFTSKETASFMSTLADSKKDEIQILDAGAGSGILSVALIQQLEENHNIKKINVDLVENDERILPLLKKIIAYTKMCSKLDINYNIIEKNFITNEFKSKYDIIVSNPPYKKIGKNDIEACLMNKVVYGQPNLYFLFMTKAIDLLKDNGEMIFIVPRSWTSGAYFKRFREYFIKNAYITNMHLFISRDKVFESENVLQETMILRATRSKKKPQSIIITQSYSNKDFNNIKQSLIEYEKCIDESNDYYVFLPTCDIEKETLDIINGFNYKLSDYSLKLKTGLTIDFRNKELLSDKNQNGTVPLLSSIHFCDGKVVFPCKTQSEQYIFSTKESLLQKNSNYLLIKRFSSKEEKRRIQPALYLLEDNSEYKFISTENHINYIASTNGDEISVNLLYGLFALYNSTIYDTYYRILNGSTQVNASEINSIPIPEKGIIERIGKKLRNYNNITTMVCDRLLFEEIENG